MGPQTVIRNDGSEVFDYTHRELEVYISRGKTTRYLDHSTLSHWHDDLEFIYMLDGEIYYNVNGAEIRLTKGEALMVNSRRLHFSFSKGDVEGEYCCLIINQHHICGSKYIEDNFLSPIINDRFTPYIKFGAEEEWHREAASIIRSICAHSSCKCFPLSLASSFFKLWQTIWENVSSNKCMSSKDSGEVTELKEMMEYIWKNYALRIKLDDIAAAGHVSKKVAGSLFRKRLQTSPVEYLIRYRIEAAADLLKNSDKTISEIAAETGFSGTSYFIETFKKYYGCTPTEFLKTL